jgi:uncharacterized protein (TIGR02246 family)
VDRRHFIAAASALAAPRAAVSGQDIASGDDSAIRAMVRRYLDARETEDLKAIEPLFTADADQLVSDGTWRKGRDQLVKGMLESSRKNPAKRTIAVESVRLLADDVALVDGRYTQKGENGGIDRAMWTAITLKRTADGWRIAAIRNMLPAESPAVPKVEPDPQTVLNEAQSLAMRGHYEEALQKHVWFHDNALRINPAMIGVRLSFALSYWVALGEHYPKARAALVAIRDKDVEAMKPGTATVQLFSDIKSINGYLDESSKTVELFKAIDADRPMLAARSYLHAEETLADAGEYALCGKYIPEPEERLVSSIRLYRMHAAEESSRPRDFGIPAYAVRSFVKTTRQLITILARAGRKPEAELIQRKALEVLDDPRIRDAIVDVKTEPKH